MPIILTTFYRILLRILLNLAGYCSRFYRIQDPTLPPSSPYHLPRNVGNNPLYSAKNPSAFQTFLKPCNIPRLCNLEDLMLWTISLVLSMSAGYTNSPAIMALPVPAANPVAPFRFPGMCGSSSTAWKRRCHYHLINI